MRFFRLAYGSHHGSMDWAGVLETGAAMLADSKIEFAWYGTYDSAEERAVAGVGKLAINMVLLAANALPRGGQLEFAAAGEVGAPRITIRGKGAMLVLDDISADAHASGCRRDGAVLKDLNARYVQPYLTGLLAAELGLVVRVEASGEGQLEVSSAPA
ncbi:MAG: histidine phosphotransferase family protein [Alphaproteobacteria bacterium]